MGIKPVILLFALSILPAPFSGCRRSLPVLGVVPDFSLVNQEGEVVRKKDLEGSAWIADFIYTGCGTVCPMLTQRMAELRKRSPVRLVSFTVDPDQDTPERLKEYAQRFEADPARWLFLTGPSESVRKTVVEGFKLSLQKASETDIFHSNKFVLVDARGRIRGYFDADAAGTKALLKAVRRLGGEDGGRS